jgi:prophage regulatory protein
VVALVGVNSSTLWRWQRAGRFPSPIKLGPNSVGWRERDVLKWLDSRPVVGQVHPAA